MMKIDREFWLVLAACIVVMYAVDTLLYLNDLRNVKPCEGCDDEALGLTESNHVENPPAS